MYNLFAWLQREPEPELEPATEASSDSIEKENLNHILSQLAVSAKKLARAKHCLAAFVGQDPDAGRLIETGLLIKIPDDTWDAFGQLLQDDVVLSQVFKQCHQARSEQIKLEEWSTIDEPEIADTDEARHPTRGASSV
jgi:hypothetical protein